MRANDAAVELLGSPTPLVGHAVTSVVGRAAARARSLDVRVRWLQHEGDVLRLYAIIESDA